MEFISQAVTVLQTLVIALGAGLAVNASRFCFCSTALGGNDCLGCLADKTPRAWEL